MHASDHSLRLAKVKLSSKMMAPQKKKSSVTTALRTKEIGRALGITLRNRFSALLDLKEENLPDETDTNGVWNEIKRQAQSRAAEVKLTLSKRSRGLAINP